MFSTVLCFFYKQFKEDPHMGYMGLTSVLDLTNAIVAEWDLFTIQGAGIVECIVKGK